MKTLIGIFDLLIILLTWATAVGAELPASFDLRNVDGVSFVTPVRTKIANC